MGLIQFPWRLLALTAFTTSALAGIVTGALLRLNSQMESSARVQPTAAVLVLGFLVMFSGAAYVRADLQPVEPWREDGRAVYRFEEEHPDMIAYTEWVSEPFTESPMSDDYRRTDYEENYTENGVLTRLAIVEGTGRIVSQYSRGSSGGGVVEMDTPGVVRIHEFYFPGWCVSIDGEPVTAEISDAHGLLEVPVPAGEHRIDARMGTTSARTAGSIISWSVLLLVGFLLLWSVWRGRDRRSEA